MNELEKAYRARYAGGLQKVAGILEASIREMMVDFPRIDRIAVRAKSVDRFLAKAATKEHSVAKYSDPLNQIQDQLGARIVTFYLNDVADVAARVLKYFTPIEIKNLVPDSDDEFGYVGKHFIFLIPSDVIPEGVRRELLPTFFELQVKTLFQHAWAEASHDLAYKPHHELTADQKRRVAFTAAQAWGADMIFGELQQVLVSR